MKKTKILFWAISATAAFGLAGCQEFFTSSWGAWAEREASVPSGLSASQAIDIAETATGNCDTETAQALLPQMADFLAGTPSDELVEAAVDTAVLASGVSEAFGEVLVAVGPDVIESGTIAPADYDAVAAILESISVTTDTYEVYSYIFTTYAGGAGLADLEAAGVTAEDCALAAASLLVAQAELDGATLSDLVEGTASLTAGSDYYQLAVNLLDVGVALDGSNEIVTLIDGWL